MFDYIQDLIESERQYVDVLSGEPVIYLTLTYSPDYDNPQSEEYLKLAVRESFIKKHYSDLFGY